MPKAEYTEVEIITDDIDGVVEGVISRRDTPSGDVLFSFAIMRQYENDSGMSRTPWLFAQHAPAVRRIIDRMEARVEALKNADIVARAERIRGKR